MAEEQLHAGVFAELLWGIRRLAAGQAAASPVRSPPPAGMFTITIDTYHQSCDNQS
jgi:hypothetical protein